MLMEMLVLGGIVLVIIIIYRIYAFIDEKNELQKRLDNLTDNYKDYYELKNRVIAQEDWTKKQEVIQENWTKKQEAIKNNLLAEIESNLSDRAKAYKWIVPLAADIKLTLAERLRDSDHYVKNRRDWETIVRVDKLLSEKREIEERNKVLEYNLEYIKTLIPETEDIVEYDECHGEAMKADSPRSFLTREEYDKLTDTEKNKRALEYYQTRKKKNWEIGRDFERYVGYLFEQDNYMVEYFGIEKKLEDLGRDLIVKNDNATFIIQCKYWSKHKTIHEKHIAQLYGTTIKYILDNPQEEKIDGLFVSHTTLSPEAKRFASTLRIKVWEDIDLGEYPLIKCKNESKIYHLPMDQQYDRTKIDKSKGDFYAFTIEEAESHDLRRAYKWHGNYFDYPFS